LTLQALPYILLQGFLFGSTLVASRFSVGQFQPTTYIGIRMLLASLIHLSFYTAGGWRREWPRAPHIWRHAGLLGILGTALPMTFIVTSLQFQSAGIASVLLATAPAFTVLMAHFLLPDETLTTRKGLGVALALGGATLLALRGETGLPDVGKANPLGYGLVILGMLSSSSMTIYARKYMRNYDFFDVASIRMFAAAAIVVPLSVLLIGVDLSHVNGQGYLATGYASLVGTFSGMMLAFYIVQRFGATAASLPTYVIPVFASLGGTLVLDEQITAGMAAGMGLIALGIALINQRGRIAPDAQLG
jgi:drug/metabolite transporter (DMT)-like permease